MSPGRNFRRIFCTMAALALVLALPDFSEAQPPVSHVPGRLLVKFRHGVSADRIQGVLAAFQSRDDGELPYIGVKVLSLPPGANEKAYEHAFRGRSEVEFAEVDALLLPAGITPNDPLYPNQWHLPRIAAPDAWPSSTGSSTITIAVLDTGVDGTHPDLASKMVPGWNTFDNNSNTTDDYGHGTKVAGTAAAIGNNATGVASVAWGSLIMPVRVSGSDGYATYSAIANGLTWAANHGARVANISYIVTTSSTVTSAAQYFYNKGGIVSSSAGNYSTFDPSADNPYILTVSGSDQNDVLYSWSNTGNNVDLAAPGCVGSTTVKGGGYSSACGTSFSAPVVAGVAALVLSMNPSMTASQVTQTLQQSADDRGPAGWDPSYGWGRVNAARAVGSDGGGGGGGDTEPPSVSITSPPNGATVSGTITVQVSASDNVGVTSVSLYVDGVLLGADPAAPYAFVWDTTGVANGSHTLEARASDAAGNSSSHSVSVIVDNTPVDAVPPTIAITSPTPGSTVVRNVAIYCDANDNVGVVRVELYVDGALIDTSTSAPFTNRWNTKKSPSGAHVLQEKAYDAAGNVGTSAPITVYTK